MVWQDLIFRVVEKAGGEGARLGGTSSLCLAGAHLQDALCSCTPGCSAPQVHSGFKAPGSTPHPQLHVSSLQRNGYMHLCMADNSLPPNDETCWDCPAFTALTLEHGVPAFTLGLWSKATAIPSLSPSPSARGIRLGILEVHTDQHLLSLLCRAPPGCVGTHMAPARSSRETWETYF